MAKNQKKLKIWRHVTRLLVYIGLKYLLNDVLGSCIVFYAKKYTYERSFSPKSIEKSFKIKIDHFWISKISLEFQQKILYMKNCFSKRPVVKMQQPGNMLINYLRIKCYFFLISFLINFRLWTGLPAGIPTTSTTSSSCSTRI